MSLISLMPYLAGGYWTSREALVNRDILYNLIIIRLGTALAKRRGPKERIIIIYSYNSTLLITEIKIIFKGKGYQDQLKSPKVNDEYVSRCWQRWIEWTSDQP